MSAGRTRTARPIRTDRSCPWATSFQAIDFEIASRSATSSSRRRRPFAPSTASMALPPGFIQGPYGERTIDPFDWTEDRLLLAESFARLDLSDREAVKGWWARHGAVNLLDFGYGDAALPEEHDDWLEHRSPTDFIESREQNAEEQANVRWHLATLVRLSEHREDKTWEPA
jgi:hypothetical protein